MDTKIEYQLSPELAEAVAVEQATLLVSLRPKRSFVERRLFPVLGGILAATLFAFGNFVSESKSVDFTWTNTITAAVVGFAVGLFFGWAGQAFYDNIKWKRILNQVKKQSCIFHEKFGPTRVISWNTESIAISSAKSLVETRWQTIDKFVDGKTSIHAFIANQIAFSIPKTALSQNLTPGELIKHWEDYSTKAPKLS